MIQYEKGQQLNMEKEMRHFTMENTRVAPKHIKRHLTSSPTRNKHIEIIRR